MQITELQIQALTLLSFGWDHVFVIYKIMTATIIATVFYYHAHVSKDPEFRQKYPNLFMSLDLKIYRKRKYSYMLIPFAELIFFYKLLRYRYNTVAFLKEYAINKNIHY
jgi:hypothetical protein